MTVLKVKTRAFSLWRRLGQMNLVRQRRRLATTLIRLHFSSSLPFSSRSSASKLPLLYNHIPEDDGENVDPSTVTLQLLSWGRGPSGQLGGGNHEDRTYPSPVANLVVPKSFSLASTSGRVCGGDRSLTEGDLVEVGISCGLFHSSLIVDGKLWIWGRRDHGRLGFGHEDSVLAPTLNPNINNVRCVSLGGYHSVALTSLGHVFTWGHGGFGALGHSRYFDESVPRLVQGLRTERILHIASSKTFTAAITESGELYTWGEDNGDGKLELGPFPGSRYFGRVSTPSKVGALPVPVSALSCGGYFMMALTKDGKIWNWGANTNYELGRGDNIGGWMPKPIHSLEDVSISQIACGRYHSLALTDDGKVFSWGYGRHGQLGNSSIRDQKVPTVIKALADKRVIYITCGSSSSAAITDEGKLFMWGDAEHFQLGVPGLPEVQPFPVEVNFPSKDDNLGPYNVVSVSIGFAHAMCLVSRPKKIKVRDVDEPSRSAISKKSSKMTCSVCRQQGHNIRTCPNRGSTSSAASQ